MVALPWLDYNHPKVPVGQEVVRAVRHGAVLNRNQRPSGARAKTLTTWPATPVVLVACAYPSGCDSVRNRRVAVTHCFLAEGSSRGWPAIRTMQWSVVSENKLLTDH